MPQPLRSVEKLPDLMVAPGVLVQRPALATHIAIIAALWTSVDTTLGHILTAMLGANVTPAMAMYLSLRGSAAGSAALKAVAETSALPVPMKKEFTKLLEDVRCRATERNRVVHGMWGITSARPDALLWTDPAEFIELDAERSEASHALSAAAGTPHFPKVEAAFRAILGKHPKFQVYKENDFIDIEQRIDALVGKLFDFRMKIVFDGSARGSARSPL